MKVLFTNEAPLIRYGLAEGFRQIGCSVRVIQGASERLWGQTESEQKQRLNWILEDFMPDFVFTEGHPGFDPQTVCRVINQKRIPHLYWAIEDPVSTSYLSMAYARLVHYVFTTAVECIPLYQSINKPSSLLLFGCNPSFHRNVGQTEQYEYDIVLIGSNYSARYEEAAWFVMPLAERGYRMKVWGHWWNDPTRPVHLCGYPEIYGGLLPYEEMPAVYSSAKIILGMNNDGSSATQTSMRPYEALACGGGLLLAHYTRAQANIFGSHIRQTESAHETIQAVEELLALPEAERIHRAALAQSFVYQAHNYQIRARQVLDAFASL